MESSNKNLITDEERKYFVMTPRLVGAICTSPFELALWNTIKDISGETGECYISTPDLALLANMSDGSVSNYRRKLIEKKLLKGEIRKDTGYPQPVWHLRIPDLWPANIEFVKDHPTIEDRVRFKKEQKNSLQEMKAQIGQDEEPSGDERGTPGDERGTPGDETKNIKKKSKNKNHSSAPKQAERFNTYLSGELKKDGKPKSEYQLRCEALEVWFVRCRLGEMGKNAHLEGLLRFLPDWSKGGAGLMKTWRSPLDRIYKKCESDLEMTQVIIKIAIDRLKHLTISMPVQIEGTIDSIMFDVVSGKIVLADYLDSDEEQEFDSDDQVPTFPELLSPEELAKLQGASDE